MFVYASTVTKCHDISHHNTVRFAQNFIRYIITASQERGCFQSCLSVHGGSMSNHCQMMQLISQLENTWGPLPELFTLAHLGTPKPMTHPQLPTHMGPPSLFVQAPTPVQIYQQTDCWPLTEDLLVLHSVFIRTTHWWI